MSAEHRHEPDAVSLMSGLLLLLIGALFLLRDLTTMSLDDRWVWPAALIVIGAAGLLSTLRTARP